MICLINEYFDNLKRIIYYFSYIITSFLIINIECIISRKCKFDNIIEFLGEIKYTYDSQTNYMCYFLSCITIIILFPFFLPIVIFIGIVMFLKGILCISH